MYFKYIFYLFIFSQGKAMWTLKSVIMGRSCIELCCITVCHVGVFIVLIKTLQASGRVQKLFVIPNDVPVLTKSWYDGCYWNQICYVSCFENSYIFTGCFNSVWHWYISHRNGNWERRCEPTCLLILLLITFNERSFYKLAYAQVRLYSRSLAPARLVYFMKH